MKQRFAKIIALALAVIMIVTAFPVSAYTGAQDPANANDSKAAKDFLDWISRPIDQFKPTYPAQSMEDNVLGGTSVHVDAPRGALPADTELDVVTIADLNSVQDAFDAASDERGQVFAAVDINFINNGEEVEPRQAVTVILENHVIANLENIRLVHFKGGADEIETAEMETVDQFYVSGSTITFDAEDFSVYAIIGEGSEDSMLTVNFWAKEDGTWKKINSQAIRMSKIDTMEDPVFDPGVPSITNAQSFEGWSTTQNITDETVGLSVDEINDIVKNAGYNANSASVTKDYYAMVFNVRYVVYHDQAGAVLMTQSYHIHEGNTSENVKIDWPYVGFKGGQNFAGWVDEDAIADDNGDLLLGDYPLYKDNVGTIYQNGTTYPLSDTINLYPYLNTGHWLVFDNNLNYGGNNDTTSASYTSPVFYADGENTAAPTTPTRTGYEFKGWFKEAECTNQFIFGSTISQDTTVYAKWEPRNTTYHVVFWTQKVTDAVDAADADKEYDFYDARVETALTGSTASLNIENSGTTADNRLGDNGNGSIGKLGYYFFLSDNTDVDQTATVKGDGSTVLNVYYDRKVITFKYYETDKTTLWTPTGGYVAATNGDYYYYTAQQSGYYLIGTGPNADYLPANGDTTYYYDTYSDSGTYALPTYDNFTKYRASLSSYGGSHTYNENSNTYYVFTDHQETRIWYVDGNNYPYRPLFYQFTENYATGYYAVGTGPTPNAAGTHNLQGSAGSNTISGLYGAQLPSTMWPNPGDGYAWKNDETINGETSTYGYPLALTEFVPVQSEGADPTTEMHFYLLSENRISSIEIYYVGQDIGVTGDNYTVPLTSGSSASVTQGTNGRVGSNWYPNETIEGFTVAAYRMGTSGSWSTATTSSKIPLYYESGNTYVGYDGPLYVGFTRNTYKFVFYSNNAEVTPEGLPTDTDLDAVPYKYSLNAFMGAVPTNGPEGYYFDGWYADPAMNTPFDFDVTMPANNIRVYAKWTMERFRVVLDPTGGEAGVQPSDITFPGNQATTFRVDYGELVQASSINNAQREGYTLLGWYLDKEFTQPFNFANPITDAIADMTYANASDADRQGSDPWNAENPTYTDVGRANVRGKVTIYAQWRKNPDGIIGINVHYDATDKNGNTGTFSDGTAEWNDPNIYADQAKAFGQPASQPDNSEELQFLYWEILDADENVVGKAYPGQLWTVNVDWAKITDLTAKAVYYTYGDAEPEADKTATAPSREGMRADNPTYRKVTTLTEGKRYLITYTSGSTAHILGNTYYDTSSNESPLGVTATVSSNTISGDYDQYLFGVDINTNGQYQFGSLNRLAYLGTRGTTRYVNFGSNNEYWEITSQGYLHNTERDNNISGSNEYLQYYSNYNYFRGNTSGNASVITFYERVEDEITGQEFELTTELTVGNRYIIAIGDYAVGNQPLNSATNDHFIKGVRVKAQTSSVIVPTDDVDTATWEIVSGSASAGYVFKNVGNGTYLGMSSDGQCYLAATTEALASHWTYDNGTDLNNHVTESANASGSTYFFYLSYAGAFLDFTTATYTGQGVKLYAASKSYTVTFVDGCPGANNAVIDTQTVEEGGNAVPPEAPDHSAQGYIFSGWDTDYTNVHSDLTVRALYTNVSELTYTVTFRYMNSQGEWVESEPQTVQHGGSATPPFTDNAGAPQVEGFTFNSWDKKYTNITSSMTINAVYKQVATRKFEITLRALYGRANTTAKTHVYWYANNDDNEVNGGDIQKDEELGINAALLIPTPTSYVIGTVDHSVTGNGKADPTPDTLVWEGHEFLGWARIDNETGGNIAGDAHHELNEDDIFLAWDPTGNNGNGDYIVSKKVEGIDDVDIGRHVTKVAADEAHPYHDMYAVWATVFYVYHTGTKQVEKITYTSGKFVDPETNEFSSTYNLAATTTSGYLYGGYYKYYDGVSSRFNAKDGAKVMDAAEIFDEVSYSWTVSNGKVTLNKDASWNQIQEDTAPAGGTAAKAYNGYNVKWTAVPYEKDADNNYLYGTELSPVGGMTYYIKEVPADKYLRPYLHYTYYLTDGHISTAWLISDVDLSYTDYKETGYVVISANDAAENIVRSLTITTTHGNSSQTLTATSLFRTRGYLNYLTVINYGSNGEPTKDLLHDGDSVAQYWVTPDGLRVTGTAGRTYSNLAYATTGEGHGKISYADSNVNTGLITKWVATATPGD